MPRSVQRLPGALVDQIAAGEVVERPASVVKELVENAVDAGASRIRVEIRDGGARLIAVTDDGHGMTPEDARLALERHATSKLREFGDLQGIRSFGFRGEAVPAIASVSRFRIRTRARGASEGFEIRVERGVLQEAHAAGGPEGTRIEVADLFEGVPARRKFLKRATTEWGHISDWLTRAALALPHIHFDVHRDDRPAFAWPACDDVLDRAAAVLSEEVAASLVAVERDHGDLAIRALVSGPEHHRATGAGIYLFVNGRPVRDRLLRHALLHVYRDILPRGRFPTAILFLAVAPDQVDVNVHPAKWEVRFSDPQAIHQLIRRTVRDAIEGRSWLSGEAAAPVTPEAVGEGRAERRWTAPQARPDASRGPAGANDWLFAQPPSEGSGLRSDEEGAPDPAARRPLRFSDLRLLGQLLGTYLIAEDKDGLLLIDQHAAHERVLYERLRAAWLEEGVERQMLLTPLTVEMEAGSAAVIGAHAELTLALGFEVEPFGESAVVVRAVPALLAERDPLGLLRGLADELREADRMGTALEPGTRVLDAADKLFATLACHSARRAGDVLPEGEQRALLDALDSIPWAPTCPHGRPVATPLSVAEIERRFGRR
ncbi:MAG: DNA mismatch repair endonuclease MutL [Deltaproteobacteria bacterium]|nr:DNA mismatch repair endonuclease MutL [Deltaproteobacteria bacterium]MBW2395165.1 DNA mismatch repair endonuclease MutL [Deltaproteobacteria bacterium]